MIVARVSFTMYPIAVDFVKCLLEVFTLTFTQSLGSGFNIRLVRLLFLEFV